MAYFATTYRYTDDVERRGEVRPTHRDYLAGLTERGQLQVSGPFSGGEPGGALLVFIAETDAEARSLINADPFARENTEPHAGGQGARSLLGTRQAARSVSAATAESTVFLMTRTISSGSSIIGT